MKITCDILTNGLDNPYLLEFKKLFNITEEEYLTHECDKCKQIVPGVYFNGLTALCGDCYDLSNPPTPKSDPSHFMIINVIIDGETITTHKGPFTLEEYKKLLSI